MDFIEIEKTLKECQENGIHDFTKSENFEKLGINVKKYLSIVEKSMFVNDMLLSCVEIHVNGMSYVDYIQKLMSFEVYILRDYVGIVFDEDDIVSQYDLLKSSGVIESVINQIPKKELEELHVLVYKTLEQGLAIENSLEGIVANGINSFIELLPNSKQLDKWVKSTVKAIKDFNPEKYEKINELLDFTKGESLDVKPEKPKVKKTTKKDDK